MKPVISRIVQALVVMSFVAAMTAVVAPAARADPPPPCYGSGCNGKDPQATGCSGSFAYTVASFTVDYGYIRVMLRYSDWCHANWTTVSIQQYAPADGGEFWVENTYGNKQYYGFDVGQYSTFWTNMVNGIPKARSCEFDNVTYNGTNPGCTGWY